MAEVICELQGRIGCISLNRPRALNALSLDMIRHITQALLAWQDDPKVLAIALRGMGRDGPFGSFCAGGDIRFFHQAVLDGNPQLEDFFTEEYCLNHLLHRYPKPVLSMLDGVVMGGGMGLAQGSRWRGVTQRTRMAMPETAIGLFPDVAGGYFLSRCPGHVGEYLALTGISFGAEDAIRWGLADVYLDSQGLAGLWSELTQTAFADLNALQQWLARTLPKRPAAGADPGGLIDAIFSLASVRAIVQALEAGSTPWHQETATLLRQRSPLMLHVALEQVRRARQMSLADELRMERNMMRHCFHAVHLQRTGAATDAMEGIRALAVDKDQTPRWLPPRIEDVQPEMVAGFFEPPWPAHAHPLRGLCDD